MRDLVKRNYTARKVAKGAAGLAAAAGLVAVGAALMDEEVRENLSLKAQTGVKALRNTLSDGMEEGKKRYESFAHEIRSNRGRKVKTRKKAAKRTK